MRPGHVADAPPRLIIVTDTGVCGAAAMVQRIERVVALCRPRAVMVQLRDKELPVRERLALGRALVPLCRRHAQWFAVNDRLDLAVILGADAVHLGEQSVSVADARRVVPEGTWISRARHDPDAAFSEGEDAVILAPVAAERKGRPPIGVEGLARANGRAGAIGHDAATKGGLVYALGGVDASNAREFLDAGAAGVAVIGAVLDGRDPAPLVKALDVAGEGVP